MKVHKEASSNQITSIKSAIEELSYEIYLLKERKNCKSQMNNKEEDKDIYTKNDNDYYTYTNKPNSLMNFYKNNEKSYLNTHSPFNISNKENENLFTRNRESTNSNVNNPDKSLLNSKEINKIQIEDLDSTVENLNNQLNSSQGKYLDEYKYIIKKPNQKEKNEKLNLSTNSNHQNNLNSSIIYLNTDNNINHNEYKEIMSQKHKLKKYKTRIEDLEKENIFLNDSLVRKSSEILDLKEFIYNFIDEVNSLISYLKEEVFIGSGDENKETISIINEEREINTSQKEMNNLSKSYTNENNKTLKISIPQVRKNHYRIRNEIKSNQNFTYKCKQIYSTILNKPLIKITVKEVWDWLKFTLVDYKKVKFEKEKGLFQKREEKNYEKVKEIKKVIDEIKKELTI